MVLSFNLSIPLGMVVLDLPTQQYFYNVQAVFKLATLVMVYTCQEAKSLAKMCKMVSYYKNIIFALMPLSHNLAFYVGQTHMFLGHNSLPLVAYRVSKICPLSHVHLDGPSHCGVLSTPYFYESTNSFLFSLFLYKIPLSLTSSLSQSLRKCNLRAKLFQLGT